MFSESSYGKTVLGIDDADSLSEAAAEKVGVQGVGWHSLRHSYKSWCSAEKIAPGMMKDLMRHADIGTTMDVYGHTLTKELRLANSLVASKLFPKE